MRGGGVGRTGRHLPWVANWRKIAEKMKIHLQIQIVSVPACLRTKKNYLSLTRRAQHRTRGGDPIHFTKGLARTGPLQITTVMCLVKFDSYKKAQRSHRLYATPRHAEILLSLLKFMRK